MPDSRRLCRIVLLVVMGVLIVSVVGADDKSAAKVNGEIITEAVLLDELMARHGYAVLETMIEALAIRQQAEEKGVSAPLEEVEARYQRLRADIVARKSSRQLTDAQAFAMWLAQRDLNPRTFRQEVELQILLEAMVKDEVNVTEREVAHYYETNARQLERAEMVRVSHITVTTEEEAERIRQQILARTITFEEAAREYSIDPYGRENGGLLPWMGRGELPNAAWEPVREQAFKLKLDGEISAVFQTTMGWDILRREAYQKGGTPPFEDIQEELTTQLYRFRLARTAREMRSAIIKMAKVERLIEFPSAGEETGETEEAAAGN